MIMKIEKISDNQIRCTLTRADLADRQLQLSELAYGTEKAKSLFRDMMQQAAFEFGFEAEDIPLMIEAIPSADSVSYTHLDVYKRQYMLWLAICSMNLIHSSIFTAFRSSDILIGRR